MLEGSCHCGAITVRLTSRHPPAELPVRICGCTFCLKHRPRYTSDPEGWLQIRATGAQLTRYRFGLRLADFLLCKTCGVFVAAFEPGDPPRAVVNLDTLVRAAEFVAEPTRFTGYDTEDAAARTKRRAGTWTPAALIIG